MFSNFISHQLILTDMHDMDGIENYIRHICKQCGNVFCLSIRKKPVVKSR